MPNKKVDPYPTIPNLTPAPKPKLGIGDKIKNVANESAASLRKLTAPMHRPAPTTPQQQREYDLHLMNNPERKREMNEALNSADNKDYKIKK